jgi:hypothetical protein
VGGTPCASVVNVVLCVSVAGEGRFVASGILFKVEEVSVEVGGVRVGLRARSVGALVSWLGVGKAVASLGLSTPNGTGFSGSGSS